MKSVVAVLQARRKAVVNAKTAEVWLDVDSQNHAGAMVRSKVVCAFRDIGKPESVETIEVFKVTSR